MWVRSGTATHGLSESRLSGVPATRWARRLARLQRSRVSTPCAVAKDAASYLEGLQPTSDGLQPNSDGKGGKTYEDGTSLRKHVFLFRRSPFLSILYQLENGRPALLGLRPPPGQSKPVRRVDHRPRKLSRPESLQSGFPKASRVWRKLSLKAGTPEAPSGE